MMKTLFLFVLLGTITVAGLAQDKPLEINLYPGEIPNQITGADEEKVEIRPNKAVMITKVRTPTLTVFLPEKGKANGTAVIICPGGGYAKLSFSHEGTDVARKLAEQGVAAFVLKYRLPDPAVSPQTELAPLQDAQQALLTVRLRAREWGVNPEKVGIMGFSAGGHLASTAGTHFSQSHVPNPKNRSVRPDFMVLVYPVINADSALWHRGSFNLLLGKNASAQKLRKFSNDLQVTPQTPPTFLVHAADDKVVPVQNSIQFYQAMLKHKVPGELHVYQSGGHGFGLLNKSTQDLWFDRYLHWMEANGLLTPPAK